MNLSTSHAAKRGGCFRGIQLCRAATLSGLLPLLAAAGAQAAGNLVPDPSFEEAQPKDRWGHVFARWGGWIYEGECEFRVSDIAHSGRHSLLMAAGTNPKIRAAPRSFTLEPGRYRITAYLRGLDIGTGVWNQTTEFMFEEKYLPLHKNGTFGWTRLTYVGEVTRRREFGHPSFGLMAPGYLWVDDVTVERVGGDVPLTPEPVLGREEEPIVPTAELGEGAVRCVECGYRNMAAWGRCYACGAALELKAAVATSPTTRLITSFEETNPFDGGTQVSEHATDGAKALRLDRGYTSLDRPQDWTGYDYVKADVHTDAKTPLQVYFEVRDTATRDYWTRVNYTTLVPPGSSTLVIPTALYVGEKSRPGRPLMRGGITRMVFSIGDQPEAPLYLDHIRLERDTETAAVRFPGLWAFDLGPGSSPVMEGFTPLDVSKRYTPGRGYGWKNARFWRTFDALQPDPLYQDFICVESGGLALDVPNGRYHVFVNLDSPSGFWGEYQTFRHRALLVEGVAHEDTMDFAAFKRRYFRFWDTEDLPTDNTFDKYQAPYFTAASSFRGSDRNDPHFRLSQALHVADWNVHDEAGVALLHEAGGDWAFYNGGNRWTYGVYLYKAAKQFDMKFRLSWHWNASAGDPYYALDCREDDYSWCSASPDGQLISTVHFERLREGLDDYRRLLTLARLVREQSGTPAAQAGRQLLSEILGAFKLGDRDLKGAAGFPELRGRLEAAITSLRPVQR